MCSNLRMNACIDVFEYQYLCGDEGISGSKYNASGMEGTSGRSDFDATGKAQAGAQQGEQELATKMLQIQSKRFYLDVKQNRRGRFIKVAEIGADGRRSQVYLALSTAAEFRDHLSTFSDYYASLVKFTGPPNPDNLPEDGKLKSEMMIKDNRRYYLDLKENARGRFLRLYVCAFSFGIQVSQTITRGGPRSQIAIPAQGMIEFRDALTDLLEEFGTNDGGATVLGKPLLPSQLLAIDLELQPLLSSIARAFSKDQLPHLLATISSGVPLFFLQLGEDLVPFSLIAPLEF
ncbi:transcriptional activator protein Pur-alpha-like [Anastrepha ludens]|uniref:transcriptional activator protein Pur-alpha-like n=1 Tax=Anastrepha ludens TaxID=28586 RepID=UPI0023B05FB2|nr:transcriptional activator protein Pur-alpha-like [Anastrepha ludens]